MGLLRASFILIAFALFACQIEARQLKQAESPLQSQFHQEVANTIGAAGSPSTSASFRAAYGRALGYARAPIAPADQETTRRAVDVLTNTVPAPGPDKYQLAGGYVAGSNTQYEQLVPSLSLDGQSVYNSLRNIIVAG